MNSAGWRRVAFLLFVVGWGANHFAPLLLVYRRALALDQAAPALLFASYALGLAPSLLFSGPLSDRYGRRTIVLPAALLALFASAMLGIFHSSFPALMMARTTYGLAAGAVMNPGAVWLLDLSADTAPGVGARRATIALSAGFGFGPLISGALAQFAPWPTVLPFAVHAATLTLACAIAWGAPTVPTRQKSTGPLLRIGLDRSNRAGFLGGVLPMAPWVFGFPLLPFTALPLMLGGALGAHPIAYTGLLAAITMLTGVLVQPVTKRFEPGTSARLGLAIGVGGILLAAFAVHAQLAGLLLLIAPVLGTAYGFCMTAGLQNVERLSKPETRGGLTGVYYLLTYFGFLGPWVLALSIKTVAPTRALLGFAALAALCAILLRRASLANPAPGEVEPRG